MIPSHLIECPIEEAIRVVNARGEEFPVTPETKGVVMDLGRGEYRGLSEGDLKAYCLTPCKPKPVFVEAVSVNHISQISNYPGIYSSAETGCFGVLFNHSDLYGIESIPTDQLEIVLRVKKVTNNA